MENLYSALSAEDSKLLPGLNPLSASSDNIQSLHNVSKDGVESQYPLPSGDSHSGTTLQVPVPSMQLGSNDVDQSHQYKTSQHRPLVDLNRPYLQHPKYLDYLARQRHDIGADGKPIWPTEIENAFQNALVHIKPLGRKKRSQRGKLYGRNMLIAEWIFRETGAVRDRKQVSSHLQVLSRMLKGIPEWDRVIRPSDEKDTAPTEGHKFYRNSTKPVVNQEKPLGRSIQKEESFIEDDSDFDNGARRAGTSAASLTNYGVQRLHFEMWVCPPSDWEQALHNYTRLQSLKLMSVPLEGVMNWRQSFPHLQPIMDDWSRANSCELILLNASFHLTEDFPPRHSKLGISLELDFVNGDWSSKRGVKLEDWACVTHMYCDGHLIAKPSREACRSSRQGRVEPFFQSRWWASKFTSLTEARKRAKDSNDPGAIQVATEQSRNFFRSLTIMQEIRAVPSQPADYTNTQKPNTRRMAVLLWKFSQAPPGSVGTTTWQTLVPPPDRLATNSPLQPVAEIELPPLTMDTIVDYSPRVNSFGSDNHFLSQNNLPYGLYSDAMDEELCQDGFMFLKPDQMTDFGHLPPSFDMPSGQGRMSDTSIGPVNETFDISQGDWNTPVENHPVEVDNTFEISRLLKQESSFSNVQYAMDGSVDNRQPSHEHFDDQPLTRFNVKTSQVLQEQLCTEDHPRATALYSPQIKGEPDTEQVEKIRSHLWSQDDDDEMLHETAAQQQRNQANQSWNLIDEQDEALRAALLAASAMSDLGIQKPQTSPNRHEYGPLSPERHDESRWEPPLAFCPTLHTHHHFPGIGDGEAQLSVNHTVVAEHMYGDVLTHSQGTGLSQQQPSQHGERPISGSLNVEDLPLNRASAGASSLVRPHSEPDLGSIILSDRAAAPNSIDICNHATEPGLDMHTVMGCYEHGLYKEACRTTGSKTGIRECTGRPGSEENGRQQQT
ncbi:uncharacterized protein Z518_02021 [Rhinocladiella mackenziei CBS 650.93]|uniref:TEA domain-containing protein n=1 Tax=Rhinocladiella mackenziei CBS 650.93 TaxID=1442369 RepID=A0A0D2HA58_9EURO|nr:uncharacterized protein Z518_02021 [Rhinocladiella mackenziei CBS 650.93]KIX07368.1 hypothetical protein Z518_02021 [Rhinocladiella mackenziei CBS 650.93]